MVLKEAVSLAVEGGKYVCGTVKEELTAYLAKHEAIQNSVDYARERWPDMTEKELTEYAYGGTGGQRLLQAKECLDQMGYDVSNLPVIEVPEFIPGVAGAVTAGAMGAAILYMRAKDRLYKRNGLTNSL